MVISLPKPGEENALEKRTCDLENLTREACSDLQNADPDARRWIVAAFAGTTKRDTAKRWFIRQALQEANQMPEWLFVPMIRAAVYEQDHSFNGWYIYPCLRCFGPHRVNDELFRYLEAGTNVEKAEGFKAFYHSTHRQHIEAFYRLNGGEIDPPEYFINLKQRLADWLLTEFVANPDLDVRRRIVVSLRVVPENYSPEIRPLLSQAIKLASEHTDTFIRNEMRHKLGEDVPRLPWPPLTNSQNTKRKRRFI